MTAKPSETRPGWIRFAQTTALVAASLLFCALCIEVVLRVDPELLGSRTANQLFSKYGRGPGDIYFEEDSTGMLFMHPGFQTKAYFNGYSWNHATDARGFRNPPGRPVDGALLLGDSLIYGHGVEEPESLASKLESVYRRRVYNLSRQGDSLYQHYVQLRLHLETFAPESVVLFVFHNDFKDLLAYRGVDLLRTTPEIERDDYDQLREQLAKRPSDPHSWSRRLRYRSLTYRLFLTMRSRVQRIGSPASATSADRTLGSPLNDPETLEVIRRYYDRILGDLATRSRDVGARLFVVYLDVYPTTSPETRSSKANARELLAAASRKHAIALHDTDDLLTTCDACVLVGDGHLSEEGHLRLAGFVDALLDTRDRTHAGRVDAPTL